ncbi:MAG: M20/M25/M40 family metallo-hydrolase [Mycobacterium leprae]
MDLATHLADLTRVSNITGRERPVADLLLSQWTPMVDEAKVDRLGSYIGLKRGESSAVELRSLPHPGPESMVQRPGLRPSGPPKVLAAAHMDSIGCMVTAIEPGGFLRFTTVGGVDRRLLMAQQVEVHGTRVIAGLVGSKPPHVTTPAERTRLLPPEDLYIDTGLSEDEVRALVPLGAPVLPHYEFRRLQGERVSSRYLDNRAGVATLAVALDELKQIRHTADFYAVGTVGEEFGGLPGAATTTFAVKPDVGIAVDVTFARHPGSEEDSFPLGDGPTIGVGPNCTPKLAKLMRQVADELGIKYALEVLPGSSGTDAWGMQVVRGGVATGVLSIPLRYMHTPVETVDLADIRAAGRLLANVVARIDAAFVEDLTCY